MFSRIFLILVVMLVGFWLFTAVTQVNPGENVVVSRFGRVLDEPWGPGLHFGFPWGIDEVKRVNVDFKRTIQVGYVPAKEEDFSLELNTPPGQMLTGDQNIVNIQAVIHYQVRPEAIKRFAFQQEKSTEMVKRASEATLSELVSKQQVDTLLSKGKSTVKNSLSALLVERTNVILKAYDLGVIVTDAQIGELAAPNEVKDAFNEVAKAATQSKTREEIARKNQIQKENEAKQLAYRIRRDAEAYAQDTLYQAKTDAKNFRTLLAAYDHSGRDPYWLSMYWWDEMSPVFSRMNEESRIQRLPDNGLNNSKFVVPLVRPKR